VPVVPLLCWSRSDFDQYWYYFQGSQKWGISVLKKVRLLGSLVDDVLAIILPVVVASLAKTGEVDVGNVVHLIISASVFLLVQFYWDVSSTNLCSADKLNTRSTGDTSIHLAFILALLCSCHSLRSHPRSLDETDKVKSCRSFLLRIC